MDREKAQKAQEVLNWWMSQADCCLTLLTKNDLSPSPYTTLCCLQMAAEFIFKAPTDAIYSRQTKTKDPYQLMKAAALLVPAISNVFPRDTAKEKRLFHYLKPGLILMRGDAQLLPAPDEMKLLINRIQELHRVVKAMTTQKINEVISL